jgi:hypothetical protein
MKISLENHVTNCPPVVSTTLLVFISTSGGFLCAKEKWNMDLFGLRNDYFRLEGYSSSYEQKRSFAAEHFQELLNFATTLSDEKEYLESKPPKRTIADNYPAGGFSFEPCEKCLDYLSVLEEISKLGDSEIEKARQLAEKEI